MSLPFVDFVSVTFGILEREIIRCENMRFNVLCIIVLSLLCCLVRAPLPSPSPSARPRSRRIPSPSPTAVYPTGASLPSGWSRWWMSQGDLVYLPGKPGQHALWPEQSSGCSQCFSGHGSRDRGLRGETIKRITQISRTSAYRSARALATSPPARWNSSRRSGHRKGAAAVNVVLEFSGIKMGPDSGAITFSLTGITDGSAHVIAWWMETS